MVELFVVLRDDLFCVTIRDDARIHHVFQELKSNAGRRILGRTIPDDYVYYKLKSPVPLLHTAFDRREIVRTCLHQSNWEELDQYHPWRVLSATLEDSYVYMVIQPRGGETERAIADLKTDFAELFSCLQITVSNLQRWTIQDVFNNLAGGELWGPDVVDRPGVSVIEESLNEHRTYLVPGVDDIDYWNARIYHLHFAQPSSMSSDALTRTRIAFRATHPPP